MGAKLSFGLLIFVSFIEGGCLMAFEILSAKLYTPYLGSSIYVWTAILSITLAGLALGYKLGGKLSEVVPEKRLFYALLIATLTIVLSVYTTPSILESLLDKDVKTASILGGLLIIFIPVTALGVVSPLLVGILFKKGVPVGYASGLIYGVGTVGGILLLLFTTFVLIPVIGVTNSIYLIGVLLLIAAAIVFLIKDRLYAK